MFNGKMTESPGCGCSARLLILLAIPFLMFLGVYQVFVGMSQYDALPYIPTSSIAAQRCRDKFNAFKNNEYVRQTTLTEIEINSAIQEDIQKGSGHVATTWIKLGPKNFTIEGVWSIVDLGTSEERISSLEIKSKQESVWRLKLRFKISGELQVVGEDLHIMSPKVIVGKVKLPQWVVSFLRKVSPGFFIYSISPQIKHVWLKKEAIELIKD